MRELIVDFQPKTEEGRARAVIEAAGGTVRRRMRSDDPSLVRLLARLPSDEAVAAVKGAKEVARTEDNADDYHAL